MLKIECPTGKKKDVSIIDSETGEPIGMVIGFQLQAEGDDLIAVIHVRNPIIDLAVNGAIKMGTGSIDKE